MTEREMLAILAGKSSVNIWEFLGGLLEAVIKIAGVFGGLLYLSHVVWGWPT